MRNDGISVNAETDAQMGDIVSDEVLRKMLLAWKGEKIDFGGGVEDIICKDVMFECKGTAAGLKKLFPFLSKAESEEILSSMIKFVAYDV